MPWRGPSEPGEFPTLGWLWTDWIESKLFITDGPMMGQPFRLYDEQVNHLLWRGRLNPEATEDDGNDAFQFGGSQLIRGQKWGKDPLLAAIALLHAFGPCDFAGWDANGEPVGRPHPSPWVGVAALNDLQANNTWLPLKAMLESSDLADLPGVDITMDLIRLPGGNPMERLTTTAFGRLGGRFTAVTLTENGLMTATGEGGNTGKRSPLAFARTLIRSVAGMQGMWGAASNTWDPTEMSHAQQVYEAKDPHTYVDARVSRARVELADDKALLDELSYLYGDALRENGGHVSSQRLIRDCRNPAMGEAEVRRFFLSEILAGERPLAEPERWAALDRSKAHPDHEPLTAGERVTLGFDGSRSRDATVLTACRIRDGRLFHLRTWLPGCHHGADAGHRPEACPDPRVPRTEVDQAVRDAFAGYEVWYMYADPYKWQDYLDAWAAAFTLDKDVAKQKKLPPKRVVEQPTNVESRMDAMIERFTTAVKAGELTHDGNADLAEHLRNANIAKGRRKPSKPRLDDDGNLIEHYLKLVKKREGLLIDAAVSALLAYEARGQAIEEGGTAEPEAPAPAPVAVDNSGTGWSGSDGLPDLNTIRF